MRLLVTGGAGFIGSNFVKYIHRRNKNKEYPHKVISVIDKLTYAADRKRVQKFKTPLYKFDVATVGWDQIFEYQEPDCVVHFAASTHVDNSIQNAVDFIHSNYTGVYKLVQGIREYNKSHEKSIYLIHIGSDEEYGDLALNSSIKFRENHPLKPNNPYSATKAAASLMIQALHHTYKDFNYTICRAANNYGPNQHMEKFLPTIIRNILNETPIPVYGKGQNIREWLYVEDFCSGIERIISTYASDKRHLIINKDFNFGSGDFRKNIDVVKLILKEMHATEKLISFVPDRLGHDRKYAVNTDRVFQTLNWSAEKKFIDGIHDVIYDVAERVGMLKKLGRIRHKRLIG